MADSATIATPRADANSMAAHQQLLAKARTGRIDLYFLGDSITRRWGCTDPQWARLYDHWRQNFLGWNAGNFGWGADRIENILWRIENGELDGVQPKVIVLLAGTNNLGGLPTGDARARDVVAGIRKLITTCQSKAPRATLILTAIFPRNDCALEHRSAVWREIYAINAELAKLADGERIVFLNVNNQLASSDGELYEGMTVDGLHPDVQGYEAWAQGLRPILERLLGPRATTDLAPPPTGDPAIL